MSEFSLSPTTTTKKIEVSSLLPSDFFLFCSFILSHPLYFSYFIFFSPYLIKIFSFLSPLFITISLLLLAIFICTLSTTLAHENSAHYPESKLSILLNTYNKLKGRLQSKIDDEIEDSLCFEELEAYKIVFQTSTLGIREDPVEVLEIESKEICLETNEPAAFIDKFCSSDEGFGISASQLLTGDIDENQIEVTLPGIDQLNVGEKKLEGLLQEKKGLMCEKEDKEVKPLSAEFDKGEEEEQKEELLMRKESKAMGNKIKETKLSTDNDGEHAKKTTMNSQRLSGILEKTDNGGEHAKKTTMNSQRLSGILEKTDNGGEHTAKNVENYQTMGSNLGSFGSMRKEKEWRRTLACKLFEERHNVDGGGEGMDSLWETYETNSNKVLSKSRTKKGKKSSKLEYYENDEDYEEEEVGNGELCCLQALKFSAGKMNLGMGRPNLVKISKALKGIGWFHHVSRHGKKV